ncbi:hypothetical protein [[Enterobacter] lignolyticus]|uniref:Uncharacterized protein n=1 Tax=Enterobacter lignolyticus (strain SCF1) TaxID=701347 RepID=E3G6G2_ENTLS|nr:hypothetical protein [[Enterobacter] lignolyticus]ADO47285.1 hypothetical protein Entcl_1013 [[Enterobacter] lignolyticus SCF1]
MKMRMQYALLMTAMFASFPGGAAPSGGSEGGAFTVNTPKPSSVDEIRGCPTLETPLRLTFTEAIKPTHTLSGGLDLWMDPWRGMSESIEPWVPAWGSRGPDAHEIHVYVELFKTPTNRFANRDGVFSYADPTGVLHTNGQYEWKHVPELGKHVYKAVIDSWNKGQTKDIYLPGRDFKSVDVFYFQNNRPNWNARHDYKKMVDLVGRMNKSYSEKVVWLKYNAIEVPIEQDDESQALFLYQKLSRSNVKDSKIDYYQFRGLLYPRYSGAAARNFILFGGADTEKLRYQPIPKRASYSMEDRGSFKNAMKIDSIDMKIMESTIIGVAGSGKPHTRDHGTFIADYSRSDFSMTPENLKACGLE